MADFCVMDLDNCLICSKPVSVHEIGAEEPDVFYISDVLARHAGRLQRDRASAPGRHFQPDPRAAPVGPLRPAGKAAAGKQNAARAGCGKAARWKSPTDFPTALGNPAKEAGFPLSHSPGDGGSFNSNRIYHVLRKPDILTC